MSTTYDINATQGSTLLLNLICKDSANNPLNFSGYDARGYVKYLYGSTGALLDLNPQIDPSFTSGIITISGSAASLANTPVGTFVYDIEAFATGSDYTFKPIKGYFNVYPESSTIG